MEITLSFTTACLAVTVVFLWLIYKMIHVSNYWETQGIPCFSPSIFQYVKTMLKPLHEHEVDLYKKLGRIYGRYDGHIPVLTVGDPDILKNILVKDFNVFQNRRDCKFGDPIMDNNLSLVNGDDWKRIRTIITPTFTSSKLKSMLDKMHVSAEIVMAEMKKAAKTRTSINADRLLGSFVMDVLASCAFGIKISSLEDPDNPFVVHAKNFLATGISLRAILPVLFPTFMKIFRISMFNPSSVSFFRDFTKQAVKDRSKSNESRVDFLHLVMMAKKNAETLATEENSVSNGHAPETSRPLKSEAKFLTENELIAQCAVFFLAGFDTTSSLIRYTLTNLALHQEIQEKLYEEIKEAMKDKEKAEYDDIMGMKYLDAVVSEALRMGSPAIRMDRKAETDYVIEEKGIQILKGQLISLPIYSMHYDPEWYPDPHKFDPGRFSAEARAERHPFAYLPFGLGPRSCIGNRFALMETKLILTLIIRSFRVKLPSEAKLPLQFKVKQGQLSFETINLDVEERN